MNLLEIIIRYVRGDIDDKDFAGMDVDEALIPHIKACKDAVTVKHIGFYDPYSLYFVEIDTAP